jgi:hypothetical protein
MKTPKQHGLTMKQLKAYKKISKGRRKQYWQGRIEKLNLKIKNCPLKDKCSCRKTCLSNMA